MTELISLCIFAFLAGFIDSIVGGGGLIQIPALLIFLPHTAVPIIFGTNKIASVAGTLAAALRFARGIKMSWSIIIPAAITAIFFAFMGARTVSFIPSNVLRPIILILLLFVASYTFLKKDFGSHHAPKLKGIKQKLCAVCIGATLGFYDGFFGAGTGSFLIFIFVGLLGFDFLRASAAAKIVNIATNLSALIYFAINSQILYQLAVPMAVCNVIGSTIGAKVALTKGSAFVRILFLGVVSAIIIKFAYDTLFSPK